MSETSQRQFLNVCTIIDSLQENLAGIQYPAKTGEGNGRQSKSGGVSGLV